MKDAEHTDLFVIQGKKDRITPKRFGHHFMQEKYPQYAQLREERLALVERGHSKWEFFTETSTAAGAQEQLRNFLAEKELIQSSALPPFRYTENNVHRELRSFN